MKKETKIKFKLIVNEAAEYTTYALEANIGNDTIPFKATRSLYNYLTNLYPNIDVEPVQGTIISEDKCFISNRQKIEYIEYKVMTEKMPTALKISPEKSIGKDLAFVLIHAKASLKDK